MKRLSRIPNVTSVEVLGPHRLRIDFDDGVTRDIDFTEDFDRPRGPVFEPLRDPEYFARVTVDRELGTIVWPNGADMDPVVLHGDEEALPYQPPAPLSRR